MDDLARSFAKDEERSIENAGRLMKLDLLVSFLWPIVVLQVVAIFLGLFFVSILWAEREWTGRRIDGLEARIEMLVSKGGH